MTTEVPRIEFSTRVAMLSLALLSMPAIACKAQDHADSPRQLAAARIAVLGERTKAPNLLATGTAEFFGIEGPLTLWIAADGRFRTRIEAKVGEQFCWDGTSGFKVDITGMPGPFGLEELDRIRLLLWVVGGHWIAPDARLDREVEVGFDTEKPPRIAVRTMHRYLDGRITLDPVTHRPSTLDFAGHRKLEPARDEHWKFDDYEQVAGCWLPRRIACVRDGTVSTRYTIDSWRSIDAHDSARWTPPTEPDDSHFDAAAPPEIAVRRLASEHLAVQVDIDGERQWMILDTGASWSTIAPAVVHKLGLKSFAKLHVATPAGNVSAEWVEARAMRVGPLQIKANRFLVMPMPDYVAANRERPVGVLGYDFFRRAVMALDLGARTLSVYPPGKEQDADWLPLTFSAYVPHVKGELLGRIRGHFLLDLGDPNEVVLSHRFVAVHDLGTAGILSLPKPRYQATDRYEPRRIDTFRVGNLHDRDLLALLAKRPQRAYESSRMAGSLGLGFLRDARLWLDYRRVRIAIQRPR